MVIKMKVLIIGGSNFIGWRLVKLLSQKNAQIVVYNRGNHDRTYPEGVTHIIGDRNNIACLKAIAMEFRFDVVFDMCAFKADQIKDLIPLFHGHINRYVFISSAAGYLDNQVLPLSEMAQCGAHPQWGPYGSGKYSCDRVLLDAYMETGFPATVVRPSYVYGPENPIDRETLLFDRITRELPVLIPYSGEGVIQLGHVDDLCSALYLIANSDKGIGEVYNISGNEYITLNGLVSLISEIIGRTTRVYHVRPEELGFAQRQLFPFENNSYFTSIEKFQNTFDWSPKISLRCGLTEAYLLWKNTDVKICTNTENEEKAIALLENT